MSEYTREELKILKDLNIDSFRELSKDGIVEFFSSLPKLDKEVAIKALEQVPDFANTAMDGVKSYMDSVMKTINLDSEENRQILDMHYSVLETLKAEYSKENLSLSEKYDLYEQMSVILDKVHELNRDNKIYKLKNIAIIGTSLAAVATIIGSAFGTNIKIKPNDITKLID